jgi:hypothetical protein
LRLDPDLALAHGLLKVCCKKDDDVVSSASIREESTGLGFFSPETAGNTLQGYEVMHMIRKGQMRGVNQGDVMGQVAFISSLFGVAA